MAVRQIEVYLFNPVKSAVLAWLTSRLGDVVIVAEDDDIQVLRADTGAKITWTPGIDDGPFTSVLVVGVDLPWAEALECCRDAAQAVGAVTRCAPPNQGHRDVWFQIAGTEESLVGWDTPPHLGPAKG